MAAAKKTAAAQKTADPTPDTTPGEGSTTLDSDVTKPSVTAPGDGPADTTDPTELASSANPDKAAAAQAGHGTVNAVVKTGTAPRASRKGKDRVETYEATRPDGTKVKVTRNIETGKSEVSGA